MTVYSTQPPKALSTMLEVTVWSHTKTETENWSRSNLSLSACYWIILVYYNFGLFWFAFPAISTDKDNIYSSLSLLRIKFQLNRADQPNLLSGGIKKKKKNECQNRINIYYHPSLPASNLTWHKCQTSCCVHRSWELPWGAHCFQKLIRMTGNTSRFVIKQIVRGIYLIIKHTLWR